MTTTLRLTAKNQLTLKKEFINHLGINIGDEMEVFKLPDGALKIQAKQPTSKKTFADISGILRNKTTVALTIDEINHAVENAWQDAGLKGTEL